MRTLLVIDDNPSVRDTLSIVLEARGYAVHSSETGEAGLAFARQNVVDGALVDIRMVGLDGVAVCRELQSIGQAQGRRIPVWLMTGAYSSDVASLGKEAGAVAVLRKPFDLSTLCQELEAQWVPVDSGMSPTPSAPVPTPPPPPPGSV
jgi:two-component system OmpR family response regulator